MKIHRHISNSTLTLCRTHTPTPACLWPIPPPPCPHNQGVLCPLLFLPIGAESPWKLLVNGHLIPPPTACHHLLSHHYSEPPCPEVLQIDRHRPGVAPLPHHLKGKGVFQHVSLSGGRRSMQVAGLPLAPANADKCRGRLLVGQRSMQSAADERRALSCVSRHIFLFGVNS